MSANGISVSKINTERESKDRAGEAKALLDDIQSLVVDFIRSADANASSSDNTDPTSTLLDHRPPKELERILDFSLPTTGRGRSGVISTAQTILRYSVNTWDQGFLDKLYHSISPVGLAAELLLTALNTNVHTYHVAPALTLIEKETLRALASLFGLDGPYAGGVSQPGGSAANMSSIVIARNTLFPETKTQGLGSKNFVLFTSEHGHYSLEKAAQICGFGSDAIRSTSVDPQGRMIPSALEEAIHTAKQNGETPFYVNATAGTTVFGSFDPLDAIAEICQAHNLWLHVDGSWGGSIIFSETQRHKLKGIERADSIAMCPHKMLGVPLTCSVLLGKDLRKFQKAMTLPAGYLFHEDADSGSGAAQQNGTEQNGEEQEDFYDLADLTPQCGRRGDVLKFALHWVYYGTTGLGAYIDNAFETTAHLTSLIIANPRFTLLSESPPPCLQVCFYLDKRSGAGCLSKNSRITETVTKRLVKKGFMIDYAPGEEGKFFRVVVNGKTTTQTVERLVAAIEEVDAEIS